LDTTPKYTFGLKTQLEKPNDVPAPNAYATEKVLTALDSTPKYTFGSRTQVEKPADTPGIKKFNFLLMSITTRTLFGY